jgi:hypothetical protein
MSSSSSSSVRIIIPIIIVIFHEFVSGSQPHHLHQDLNFPIRRRCQEVEDESVSPGIHTVLGPAAIKPIFIFIFISSNKYNLNDLLSISLCPCGAQVTATLWANQLHAIKRTINVSRLRSEESLDTGGLENGPR